MYAVEGGTARGNLGMSGREQGLKTLMTVNLLKRLESSVESFRITLRKVETAIDHALQTPMAAAATMDENGARVQLSSLFPWCS